MMKKSFALALFLIAQTSLIASAQAMSTNPFTDIQKDSLTYLYNHKIIEGYADQTFKPKNLINRAEFIKMVLYASHITPPPAEENCFPDVNKTEWYAPGVCYAKKQLWIEGYPDGKFHPEKNINRVEALKILAQVQGWYDCLYSDIHTYNKVTIYDIDTQGWYTPFVCRAYYNGYIDNTRYFKPSSNYNREEIAEILFRTILEEREGNLTIFNDPVTANETLISILPAMARDFFKLDAYYNSLTYDDIANDPKNLQYVGKNGDTYYLHQYPRDVFELEINQPPLKSGGADINESYAVFQFDTNKKLRGYGTGIFNHDTRIPAEMKWSSVETDNKAVLTYTCIKTQMITSYSCSFDREFIIRIDEIR